MKLLYAAQKTLVLLFLSTRLLACDVPTDYKKIKCDLVAIKSPLQHGSHPHIPLSAKSVVSGTSTNWSGYVAMTNLNKPEKKSVSAVSASWIIPTLTQRNGDSCCAVWVGIDGYYNDSTVEQIGTMQDLVNGVAQQYAWFEMYPAGSYIINGFPVKQGDVISASVGYTSKNTFTLTIANVTRKVIYTVPTSYTKSTKAFRNSAEWVVEAPYAHGILPLADFGSICFSNCKATINGIPSVLNSTQWASEALSMITNNGTFKAVPSTIGSDGTFLVAWKHQ